MILNINSPAYYSQKFGFDENLYKINCIIIKSVKEKKYSQEIDTIGIVPVIAPKSTIEEGMWKEKYNVSKKYQYADIQFHINYDEFVNSNTEIKKSIYIDSLIKSIRKIGSKIKDFKTEEMIKDILRALGLSEEFKINEMHSK